MLSANEAVAAHFEQAGIPSILSHPRDSPIQNACWSSKKSRRTSVIRSVWAPCRSSALQSTNVARWPQRSSEDIVLPSEDVEISSRNYQKLIAKIEGKPEERILSYLMLRSLKQARYSAENRGHFALAASQLHAFHFTHSPLSRSDGASHPERVPGWPAKHARS